LLNSLGNQATYIDLNAIQNSSLPYISIHSINNNPLKFLIDSGSNKSFINPELIPNALIERISPVEIKTALKKYTIDTQVTLNGLPELFTEKKLSFLLFKFHDFFDGLIGYEMMTDLGIKLDCLNSIIEIGKNTIPFSLKPNLQPMRFDVFPNCKMLVKLPVDYENGSILIRKTKIKDDLILSEGIYEAKDWFALVEVNNFSDDSHSFCVKQPLKTFPLNNDFIAEIHNFSIEYDEIEKPEKDIRELIRVNHLNKEEKESISKLCKNFEDIFYKENQNLSFTNQIKHSIKTKDDIPIYTKSYRLPEVHKEEVQKQITKLLDQGIIRPSFSPWSSPIWIVPKKLDASGEKKWRLVVDYRRLNAKTIEDRYPIPNIADILDSLGRCVYFSKLDLASGFHQIEIQAEDIPKTAFSVNHGHYEFLRMPFGLRNAPSTFQRVMDNVLQGLQGKICLVYMDDIIVYSASLQEHINNLRIVFRRLREANLKVQLDKSEFLHKEIEFLGHKVTSEGVKPNPDKIKAIKNFPIPKTPRQIKSFLGLLGYYRKFIKNFADLTKPMTNCLRKGEKIVLNSEYIECFEMCKKILCNDPILQYPDFSKPFNLTTDASNVALGAVLSQGKIGSDKPVCFASRTLSKSEQNYSTTEKELLAIVWATKHFRPYLYGRKFNIVTDHKSLQWLFSHKEPGSKLIRWRLRLEEFDYEIKYKNGKQNTNADALSRVEINNNESNESMVNNVDDIESIDTIHSEEENIGDGIFISEKPINEFKNQLIFERHESISNSKTFIKILFKTKKRLTIKIPNKNYTKLLTDILKEFCNKKELYAILTDDETFKNIQALYSEFFCNGRFKLIRCMTLVKDITELDLQEKIIREYHKKSNHRGISETLEHIKREYYFPLMKNIITKIINSCDICMKLKYERRVQPLKYEITETPKKPLEILHTDIYSVNKAKFLTIIDKFSKFACAYLLVPCNSINIVKSFRHFFFTPRNTKRNRNR